MRLWYPLCDLDGDLVALIDGGSTESGPILAAEWQYDAYGNVQWGRVHSAHPALTLGHRTAAGVFFDRLDEPVVRLLADLAGGDKLTPGASGNDGGTVVLGQTWDTRTIVPIEPFGITPSGGGGWQQPRDKPKLIGHMRNRVYLPALARFAQRDPNATGQLLMQAVQHSGRALSNSASALDLASMYGDGGNLYAYLGGSPRGRSDPLGLFLTSPAELVGHAVMIGMRGVRGGLENMTAEYAANMEDDLDWAMDWSRPDNDYSRLSNTWVVQSFAEGMRGGFEAGINAALSDLSFGLVGGEEGDGGPVARAGKGAAVSAMRSLLKHGSRAHQRSIGFAIRRARTKFDVGLLDGRVNRQIVDPQTSVLISKLRPDFVGFNPRNKVFVIAEAVVSQTPEAATKKLNDMNLVIEAATSRRFIVKRMLVIPEKITDW